MSSNTSALAWSRVWYVLFAVRLVLSEEKALHRGIVPDVVGPAHATDDAVVGQEPLEGRIGVLAPSIGVVQHGLGLAPPPDGQYVVMVACMDQPTTRREKRSTTAAT